MRSSAARPGTVSASIAAAPDELVVVVTDDGRGMQPRPDSPGLGLGLPTIARLTSAMDMHERPGGGTVITMTFAAPGVSGPAFARRADDLLDGVARAVEGAWPEGVEGLVDLLVPELADACALDVLDHAGRPERFAGRVDGPDGARQSAWLAALRPRTDAPQSATRQALDDGGVHVVELTRDHIARITAGPEDAAQMAATGIQWWIVIPMKADQRRVGLLHFGFRPLRGRPPEALVELLRAVADRAASALVTTQLISELSRTRRRFERILAVLGEAVTVQDAAGRMVYANEAAARLLGAASPDEVVGTDGAALAARFDITDRRRGRGALRGPAVEPPAGGPGRAAAADALGAPRERARALAADEGDAARGRRAARGQHHRGRHGDHRCPAARRLTRDGFVTERSY